MRIEKVPKVLERRAVPEIIVGALAKAEQEHEQRMIALGFQALEAMQLSPADGWRLDAASKSAVRIERPAPASEPAKTQTKRGASKR